MLSINASKNMSMNFQIKHLQRLAQRELSLQSKLQWTIKACTCDLLGKDLWQGSFQSGTSKTSFLHSECHRFLDALLLHSNFQENPFKLGLVSSSGRIRSPSTHHLVCSKVLSDSKWIYAIAGEPNFHLFDLMPVFGAFMKRHGIWMKSTITKETGGRVRWIETYSLTPQLELKDQFHAVYSESNRQAMISHFLCMFALLNFAAVNHDKHALSTAAENKSSISDECLSTGTGSFPAHLDRRDTRPFRTAPLSTRGPTVE